MRPAGGVFGTPGPWLNKNEFTTELLLSQDMSFKAYKMCIIAIFTHLVVKLYKNKICDVHLKLRLMLQLRAKYTVFVVCQS